MVSEWWEGEYLVLEWVGGGTVWVKAGMTERTHREERCGEKKGGGWRVGGWVLCGGGWWLKGRRREGGECRMRVRCVRDDK